jgi:thioredoxin 1
MNLLPITRLAATALVVLTLFAAPPAAFAAGPGPARIPEIPTPGMVTLVDLGAKECVPCKMMAPILAELQKEYEGRASIIFIDVWENREQAQRFGIRGIPTQILYDREGREVGRHMGFMAKKTIVDALTELGVPQ